MILVVMGVSGAGKTTVGRLLAERLRCEFLDADDFHPEANKKKMAAGVALTDADRAPWLDALAAALADRLASGRSAVLACSALKRRYRDRLRVDAAVRFVHLKAGSEALRRRLAARKDHYFRVDLLESQFQALEEPAADEALVVDAAAEPEDVVATILQLEGLDPSS